MLLIKILQSHFLFSFFGLPFFSKAHDKGQIKKFTFESVISEEYLHDAINDEP